MIGRRSWRHIEFSLDNFIAATVIRQRKVVVVSQFGRTIRGICFLNSRPHFYFAIFCHNRLYLFLINIKPIPCRCNNYFAIVTVKTLDTRTTPQLSKITTNCQIGVVTIALFGCFDEMREANMFLTKAIICLMRLKFCGILLNYFLSY